MVQSVLNIDYCVISLFLVFGLSFSGSFGERTPSEIDSSASVNPFYIFCWNTSDRANETVSPSSCANRSCGCRPIQYKDIAVLKRLFGFIVEATILKNGDGSRRWIWNWNSKSPRSKNSNPRSVNNFPPRIPGPWPWPRPPPRWPPLQEGSCILTGCQPVLPNSNNNNNNSCSSAKFKFKHWTFPCAPKANTFNVQCCKEPPTGFYREKTSKNTVNATNSMVTNGTMATLPSIRRCPFCAFKPLTRNRTTTVVPATARKIMTATVAPSLPPVTATAATIGITNSTIIPVTPETAPPPIDFFDYFQ